MILRIVGGVLAYLLIGLLCALRVARSGRISEAHVPEMFRDLILLWWFWFGIAFPIIRLLEWTKERGWSWERLTVWASRRVQR